MDRHPKSPTDILTRASHAPSRRAALSEGGCVCQPRGERAGGDLPRSSGDQQPLSPWIATCGCQAAIRARGPGPAGERSEGGLPVRSYARR